MTRDFCPGTERRSSTDASTAFMVPVRYVSRFIFTCSILLSRYSGNVGRSFARPFKTLLFVC